MTDNITIPSSVVSAVSSANVAASNARVENAAPVQTTSNEISQNFTRDNPPFVSPAIRLDYETQQVVLEFRDSESGEVERQIEPNSRVEAYSPPAPERAETVDIEISDVEVNVQDVNTNTSGNNVAEANSGATVDPQTPLASGDTSSFA